MKTKPKGKGVSKKGWEGAEMVKMAKYARGGGVEIRGKTKGKMVKMAKGGSC